MTNFDRFILALFLVSIVWLQVAILVQIKEWSNPTPGVVNQSVQLQEANLPLVCTNPHYLSVKPLNIVELIKD